MGAILEMSSRKRGSGTSASASHKQPKRQVKNETFLKWQRAHEKEHQSMAWLRADMDTQEKSLVSTLWCVACRKYESQLTGRKRHGLMVLAITKPAILLTTPPVSSYAA